MAQEYIYAVARIKARELSLLTQQDIDRLMACKTPAECFRALADKGWGTGGEQTAEAIFAAETEKTWALMHELLPDLTPFDVLLYPIDFNNLKAAVKCTVTNTEPHNVFMQGGTVDPQKMQLAVRQNDFSLLPDFMAEAASEATQVLLQTRDGQRCDVILDRACLSAIHRAGMESDNALVKALAELKVAVSDIKIAMRAQHTGKSRAFLEESLTPCATLDLAELISAAEKDAEALYAYLGRTDYADAVAPLKAGASAFEKWCDDRQTALVKEISRQDYFTIAPLLGYVTARQNEIATVRIIVSGKQNNLPDERIRARLREV
ncbi:V-type ATPase subunit [Anaeromassilibacillus senegalensis]|uniref:V-type ATPase subunit n=1 Tax=Anaeromassilibacillus senegalensis TaxID=1673717 RepID=A0ABS9CQU0_9FIRM|nr:V-type ATPase subunit [Anaeromassilibacillus senegalensis]MCF2652339.1 V-type ATPase subunit [Anaeromassilibacillus senegalensis]